MGFFRKKIEQIRELSYAKRKNILILCTASAMILVIVFWLILRITLPSSLPVENKDNSIKSALGDAYHGLKNEWKGIGDDIGQGNVEQAHLPDNSAAKGTIKTISPDSIQIKNEIGIYLERVIYNKDFTKISLNIQNFQDKIVFYNLSGNVVLVVNEKKIKPISAKDFGFLDVSIEGSLEKNENQWGDIYFPAISPEKDFRVIFDKVNFGEPDNSWDYLFVVDQEELDKRDKI